MYASAQNGIIRIDGENEWLSMNMDSDMIYYTLNGSTFRRTRMNDFLEMKHFNGNRYVRKLSCSESRDIATAFYSTVNKMVNQFPFLKEHVRDYEFLKRRGKELMDIYQEKVPIVPPDRYHSLYIRISEGCPWNNCTFCNLYKNESYGIVKFDKLKEQAMALKNYFRNSLDSMTGIFIGDANSAGINSKILQEYLEYINSEFNYPIYSFSDAFTTPKKKQDFEILKDLGMKRIYIGIESGNDKILKILNKNMDTGIAKKFIEEIKSSGINIGLIVMSGFGNEHVRDTVEFIESIEYSKGDIIYISPVKEYNDFHGVMENNGIFITAENTIREYNFIKSELKKKLNIPVVIYNVEESLY
ncbi:MAG: radical SAM protein [Ferroplasma sp.]